MKEIMVFKDFNSESKTWEHHHIEDGWKPKPVPKFPSQKPWDSKEFLGYRAYLIDNKVVYASAVFDLYGGDYGL